MMFPTALKLDEVDRLTGRRIGTFDCPCPFCGPDRRSPVNRRRPVLRLWRVDPGFATFHCARCGEQGYARDGSTLRRPPDPAALARARAEAAERERVSSADRLMKARWLWSQRQPIAGTIAETYLREARRYGGPLPATLGFLPARGKHGPAMIAAFGIGREPEPGVLAIDDAAVQGVHLTRLLMNESDRECGDRAKIIVAQCLGSPIMLAPPNDLLGMVVAEGVEDALSAHQVTGLGVWAAGGGSRLPPLADAVASYVECVTVLVDDDPTGRRGSRELAERLTRRKIEVRLVEAATMRKPPA